METPKKPQATPSASIFMRTSTLLVLGLVGQFVGKVSASAVRTAEVQANGDTIFDINDVGSSVEKMRPKRVSATAEPRLPVTTVEKQPERMVVIGDVHGDIGEPSSLTRMEFNGTAQLMRVNSRVRVISCDTGIPHREGTLIPHLVRIGDLGRFTEEIYVANQADQLEIIVEIHTKSCSNGNGGRLLRVLRTARVPDAIDHFDRRVGLSLLPADGLLEPQSLDLERRSFTKRTKTLSCGRETCTPSRLDVTQVRGTGGVLESCRATFASIGANRSNPKC